MMIGNNGMFLGARVPAYKGLIAHYKFENNANDEKDEHNGTLIGSPTFVTGVDGVANSAISLNGIDQRVDISNQILISQADNYSISYWMKVDALATSQYMAILSITSTDRDVELNAITWSGGGSSAYGLMAVGDNFNNFGDGGNYVAYKDVWVHCVSVVENGIQRIYINNIELTTQSTGGFLSGATNKSTIGSSNLNVIYFKGALDNIRVYNIALSTAEIQNIFDNKL